MVHSQQKLRGIHVPGRRRHFGTISDDVLRQLGSGKLQVRQKPGPTNALGLVKLIFPEYNVYLHQYTV